MLPSGLRIVSQHMEHAATVSLGIWIGAGARDELPHEHGLAHLLEHMAFKGTARRSARQIAEEIESVGGDLNAATSVEYTCYTARVLGSDLGLAVDILADILTAPALTEEELKREKGVILQEISAVQDTPDDLVYDRFLQAAFPDQPLGRPILGTAKTVKSFTPGRDPRLSRPGTTMPATWCWRPRARSTMTSWWPLAETASGGAAGKAHGSARTRERPLSRRRGADQERRGTGPSRARLPRHALHQRRALPAADLLLRARRRAVVAAVPGGARAARPRLCGRCLPLALLRLRRLRHQRRHRAGGCGRADRSRACLPAPGGGGRHRGGGRAGPRANEGRAARLAGEAPAASSSRWRGRCWSSAVRFRAKNSPRGSTR